MRWAEVEDWIDRQTVEETHREARKSLVSWIRETRWDAFYSQSLKTSCKLPGAHALLAHSLAVLRSSLTATAAFVAWERLSETGREGWHAHCLLQLSKRSIFAPCGSNWKRCGQPFFSWDGRSRSFKWQPHTATMRSDWQRRSPSCTRWCILAVKTEERLAASFGWARVEPIRYAAPGAITYCMKYLTKTWLQRDLDMECTWGYVDLRKLDRTDLNQYGQVLPLSPVP